MTVLIFGASGQDGHYLRELLERQGDEVVGVSRSGAPLCGDVGDYDQVESLVLRYRPSRVLHLAAASTTRHAALFENHATIATGTIHVLEAVRRHAPAARVFVAGSGVQFRNDGAPISEDTPFEAASPYALARIGSVYAARYYRSLGVAAYVGYLFHHESPLRKADHVSQTIASAARRIAAGSAETLELGDVSVVKEWTFAGDVARAILLLLDQTAVHEAVIGSGRGHSIEAWLEACFGLIGRDWRDHVRVREGFVPEYRRLVSNPARIRALGFTPEVDLAALAARMVRDPGA